MKKYIIAVFMFTLISVFPSENAEFKMIERLFNARPLTYEKLIMIKELADQLKPDNATSKYELAACKELIQCFVNLCLEVHIYEFLRSNKKTSELEKSYAELMKVDVEVQVRKAEQYLRDCEYLEDNISKTFKQHAQLHILKLLVALEIYRTRTQKY